MSLIKIHTITGGSFIADIGDSDMEHQAAVHAVFDLVEAAEVIHGHWQNPMDPDNKANVLIPVRFERRGIAWVGAA